MTRRTRLKTSDAVWDGRSKWWPHSPPSGVPGGDSNVWMCAEDLGLEIWTQLRRLEKHDGHYDHEPLTLEQCSTELETMLIDSLPFNDYRRNLSGVIVGFAQVVAQELVLSGRMSFEISIGWSGEEPRSMRAARLVSLPRRSLIGLRPLLVQVVPEGVVSDQASKRFVRLDPSRIVTFRPPRRWRAVLAQFREGCRLLGRSQHAWIMRAPSDKFPEDFKKVRRHYNIHLARLSAPLGWNARGLFREEISDFHWTVRELHWRRLCIEVRDELLTTLRNVFAVVGTMKGEHPRLEWRDLPAVEHVELGLQRIAEGARFKDVLEPFRA